MATDAYYQMVKRKWRILVIDQIWNELAVRSFFQEVRKEETLFSKYMILLDPSWKTKFLGLKQIAAAIRELTSLKTVSVFIVGDNIGNQLDELEHLNLGGALKIRHLERVQHHMNANLVKKPNLRDLNFRWEDDYNISNDLPKMLDDEKFDNIDDTTKNTCNNIQEEALQGLCNLKHLTVIHARKHPSSIELSCPVQTIIVVTLCSRCLFPDSPLFFETTRYPLHSAVNCATVAVARRRSSAPSNRPQPSSLSSIKRFLEIWGCPELERRCEKPNGEDWPKIAHIPHLAISDPD
ncbi:hypothetical protein ACS0TY_017659 [Phlomoides rotata]